MACTFIALFPDAVQAWRATDELSSVTGVDRAFEPAELDPLVQALNVAPHEARELREGARRGEHVVVVEIWGADPTACDVLDAMAGANLLVRTEQPPGGGTPRSEAVHRPRPTIESIRSDMYIG